MVLKVGRAWCAQGQSSQWTMGKALRDEPVDDGAALRETSRGMMGQL